MKTITISVELGLTKEVLTAYGEAKKKGQTTRRHVLTAWTATKAYIMARLRDLLAEYDARKAERRKAFVKQWPPHSLFCEGRCCQRSFHNYHRSLKQELHWGRDGHLVN